MIKLNNVEKDVKRFIKRKVSVTLATMVVFLMTGAFVFSTTTTATDPGENSATLRERVGALETRVDGLADRINNTTVDTTALDEKLDKTTFETFTTKLEEAMNPTLAAVGELGKGMTELTNQLENKADKDATNIDVDKFVAKLNEGADLANPTNKLVTDTIVKTALDGKLDKTEFTEEKVTEKVKKGSLTSTSLTVGGTGKVVEADITVDLTDETKAEIAKIEGKLNKSEFIEKSAKIQEELDANKQAIAEEKTTREGAVKALNERVAAEETARAEAIKAETTARETADEEIKIEMAKKADKTALETETAAREAADTAINEELAKKATTEALTNGLADKADKDATNIDVDKFVAKLNEGAKFDDTATGTRLATDADVVDVVGKTKTEIKGITDKLDGRIDNLEMAAGTTEGLAKIEELKKVVGEADDTYKDIYGDDTSIIAALGMVKNELDSKATTAQLTNETAAREAADTAINAELAKKADAADVYTKTESDERFVNKTDYISDKAKIQEELDANKQAIAEEKTTREGAVTALNERVAKEETARAEAITAEKTARETADEEIKIELAKKADKTALEAETAAREAGDEELTNKVESNFEILKEADQGLKNEIDTKANAADVYTKTESDEKFAEKANTADVTAELAKKADVTALNAEIAAREAVDNVHTAKIANHETRIENLEVRTDKLEKRIDSVASITAAMTTLDLGNVPVGQLGMGISFGTSGKSQAVAAGLGFSPTENFKLNAKFSTSTGKERRTAVGAGAVYYLNLK